MTFAEFVESHCSPAGEAPDGDKAMLIASTYLRVSGQTNDVISQHRLIDHEMRGTTYHQPEYGGCCALRLKPYPT